MSSPDKRSGLNAADEVKDEIRLYSFRAELSLV
jgi:hypothetical protein